MTNLGARFNKLWAAVIVSNLGDGVQIVAFPLLVASITRDPVLVAGATVVGRIPWLLFALPAGAMVDRMDRRRVMVAVDWGRALVVGVLGGLLLAGDVNLALVYVVAFLLGSAETMFDTASEALIPNLVAPDQLDSANGRLQASEWAANTFVGPPLGAALFAAAVALPFLFDAGTFVIGALLVSTIAGSYASKETPEHAVADLRREIGTGLSWLWRHRVLRTLAMMAGVTNLVGTGIVAIFVLFVQDILQLGDIGYGLILATIGVGGLIGSVTAQLFTKRFGPGTTLVGSQVGLGLGAVVMGATSSPVVAALIAGLYGLLIGLWNVVAVTLRQRLTPDELRGRVASVARLLAWGTQPLGALLGGVVAAGFGLRAPFYVAAVVWASLAVVVLPIVNNRRIAALQAEEVGD
ncbi:MAG: MFS transporter [Acidimicrobiia bacterium]|nr:MFS transporter [Acidimicrobiia bacterium]